MEAGNSVQLGQQAARLALDAPFEFQRDQFRRNLGGRKCQIADQLILGKRLRPKAVKDESM